MSQNVVLVTGSYDQKLIFWDPQSCNQIFSYNYPTDCFVNRLEISQDKKYLGAACSNSLQIYDISCNSANPIQNYKKGFSNNVTGIGFSKDQNWIYSSSEDGFVKIFDLRAQGFQREYKNDTGVNCIQLHPNEGDLIIGDQNGMIKIYDLVYGKIRDEQQGSKDVGIRSLSVSLNASNVVAADSAGICHVYKLRNCEVLEPMQTLQAHNDYILKCLISPDVSLMATCSADKTVKIWKFMQNKENKGSYILDKILFGHTKWVWDCAFSWGKVEYIVTCSTDTQAKIWQISTGESLRILREHTKGINCLAMNDIPS